MGIDKLPDTWEEHLAAGKKLKKFGMPIGQTLGHTFGDAQGSPIPCSGPLAAWKWTRRQSRDQQQRDARRSDFVKEFWFAACDEGGLAWDDTSNNRAFLAETMPAR